MRRLLASPVPAPFRLLLCALCLLAPAFPRAAQVIVEEFSHGDPFTQLLDVKGPGNETPLRVAGSGATGFTWGAYNAYTEAQTNRIIGLGDDNGTSALVMTYTAVTHGTYAYTIFDSTGGNTPNTTINLAASTALIELKFSTANTNPTTPTLSRYLLRTREGAQPHWYLSEPVAWPARKGFYLRHLVAGLRWYAVDAAGNANLNLLAAADEQPLTFAATPAHPDFSQVEGGGLYIESAWNNYQVTSKLDRITWQCGTLLPSAGPWKPVFSDEFSGNALSTATWTIENAAPSHILSGRWPDNVLVENGDLRLLTRKEVPQRGGKDWSTGNVWTNAEFRYGYYEARYKYGAATGLNNAFWLINPSDFEIDINEGHYPDEINMNLHNWYGTHYATGQSTTTLRPLSNEYAIYGLLWTRDELVYYFNGKEIRRLSTSLARQQAPVYFSSAVAAFAGAITDALDGTSMDVDYVRVFQPATAWTSGPVIFPDTALRNTQGSTQFIAIPNDTAATVTVGNLALSGTHAADFALTSPLPAPLPPGQTAFVDVTFKPSALGLRQATLTITSNHPLHATQPVIMQGTGVQGVIYVKPTGSDANDGLTWPTARRTVASAFAALGDNDFTDLWLAGGLYNLTMELYLSPHMRLVGGFAGTEATTAERDSALIHTAYATTLRQTTRGDRVINIEQGRDIEVDGLTLTGGREVEYGGGGLRLYQADSTVIIRNCVVAENTDSSTTGKGGGVSVLGTAAFPATPQFIDTIVSGNLNQSATGGGVYLGAYTGGTWTNCRIADNTTLGFGGGLYIAFGNANRTTFSNCSIANNAATTRGGGVWTAGDTRFEACQFTSNVATASVTTTDGGGGLFLHNASTTSVSLRRCTVAGNRVAAGNGWGGGLQMTGGKLRVENTLICGNTLAGLATAQEGAGLAIRAGDATLTHVTLGDNESADPAGAGGARTLVSTARLYNSLVTNNSGAGLSGSWTSLGNLFAANGSNGTPVGRAPYLHHAGQTPSGQWTAGGLFTADPLTSRGTTLLTALGTPFQGLDLAGHLLQPDISQRPCACIIANTSNTLTVSGDLTFLGPLVGKTFRLLDYHPVAASEALNSANPTYALPCDLTGFPRPSLGGYEIGAYESPTYAPNHSACRPSFTLYR
jgi:beta-glucanase (GH16 family)